MQNLWTIGALLLLSCTPSAVADAKAPREVNSTSSNPTSGASEGPAANVSSTKITPAPTAAPVSQALVTSPTQANTAPQVTPLAPPMLERLSYHALPQTHLGFYAVLTPPGYDAPENVGRRYPVVVILHGSGSNEVVHGSLADDIGRDDVIYVLPRAPHASPEQFAAGKQGYTAWPSYPVQWGEYGSADFPQVEVDRLQVHKFYTRWIAETLLDTRQRYRVTQNRAVVVGHSQGAMFAHLFAVDYPALVRAYAAYAGPFEFVLKSVEVQKQLASLRSGGIVPLLIHHEGDSVVNVTNTQRLDALMTQFGVKHTTHILPGGTHGTDPEVRRLLRAFTREQCCGKERTSADIPLDSDGKLSVPPTAEIVTFGPATCDERISSLTPCASTSATEPSRCEVYEAEPCGRRSMGYRSSSFACVNSMWTRTAKAPAECGLDRRDPEVTGCNVQLLRTRPSERSRTDGCDLVLRCEGVQTVVTCNGSKDGSASECECRRGGTAVVLPQSVYPEKAPHACVAAAEQCKTTK